MDKISNPKFKSKFVATLLSGKYPKATGALHEVEDGENHFCLMGVAAKVAGVSTKRLDMMDDGELSPRILKRLGMTEALQSKLIDMNDNTDMDFKELGCWIEKNL